MKAQEVKRLLDSGDYKAALRGAKDFRFGVDNELRSIMRRAYECYVRPDFYRSLGKNPEECISCGISALRSIFL